MSFVLLGDLRAQPHQLGALRRRKVALNGIRAQPPAAAIRSLLSTHLRSRFSCTSSSRATSATVRPVDHPMSGLDPVLGRKRTPSPRHTTSFQGTMSRYLDVHYFRGTSIFTSRVAIRAKPCHGEVGRSNFFDRAGYTARILQRQHAGHEAVSARERCRPPRGIAPRRVPAAAGRPKLVRRGQS